MKLIHYSAICCLFSAIPFGTFAQKNAPEIYKEVPRDPYIEVPRDISVTSPAYRLDGASFKIRQVNVDENGQNIIGDAANEPSIVVDPTNPLRMAIGWRQFNSINSDFRQAGYAFSTDGGENWNFPGPIEPGVFRSDPVLDTDADGNFYYNSLTNSTGAYTCQVFKAEAGMDTWDNGVFAFGGDKQWMVVDRTNGPNKGNIYSCWRKFISSCTPGSFTRSLDNGETYTDCSEMPEDPARGTIAIGINGEVFTCGGINETFVVMKSTNAGNPLEPVEWEAPISVDMGGPHALYAGPNPTGLLGQPWIAVDHSNGPNHGFVYMLAPIVNTITGDPADVTFSRSIDGGLTWSTPVRIHDDDSGNWQWFGSMSLAPDGRIDVTWLDTRSYPGTYLSTLWYTYSLDGGITWAQGESLSDPFDPHLGFPQQFKIGDYYQQLSDDKGVHLAWAATFNSEEDIYYSYIQPELEPASAVNAGPETAQPTAFVSPVIFSGNTTFHYEIQGQADVRADIFNAQGQLVDTPVHEQKSAGAYTVLWLGDVPAGIYFYRFTANGMVIASGKMVKQ